MVNFSSKKRTAVQSTLRDPTIARSCAPPRRDSQGDLEGAFWVDKPKPNTLHIDRISFRDSISLTYSIADQRLKAERQTRLHSLLISRLSRRKSCLIDSAVHIFIKKRTQVVLLSGKVGWK